MKLVSLGFTLFRQHRKLLIKFSDGLTGIVGPNGSGKTTLIEGIAFSLFGSRALRGKIEDVRSRGASMGTVNASLVFEHGGTVFRVDRTLSDASLFQGGEAKPFVTGNREVVNRIESILGMNYEEFVATFYTEQKGLEFLSGKRGASEREKFIMRMMGYDKLEKMQIVLRDERRDLKSAISGMEAGFDEEGVLEERLAHEEKELSIKARECGEVEKLIVKEDVLFTRLKRDLDKLEPKRKEFQELREAASKLEFQLEEAKKRKGAIESEIRNLSGGEGDEAALKWKEEISGFESRQKVIQAKINSIRDEIQESEAALNEKRGALLGSSKVIDASLQKLNERLSSLSSIGDKGECPTCGQEIDQKSAAAHLKIEIKKLNSDLKGIKGEESKLTKELSAIKEKRKEAESLTKELQKLLLENDKKRSSLDLIARGEKERASLTSEISKLEKALESKKKSISSVGYSEAVYLQEKSKADASASLLTSQRMKRIELQGVVSKLEALIARTKSDIERRDEKKSVAAEKRRELLLLEEGDTFLTEFRRYLNASVKPSLASIAGEFLSELTDGRYSEVSLSSDFTPVIIEDGEPNAVISGGETDILNLSVRLALSQLLAERAGSAFSLLVLDEVFGSLDEQRRSNVLLLLERLRGRFEQIIVITHLEDVQEGVEHLLHIDYDPKSDASVLRGAIDEISEYDLQSGLITNL